MHAVTHCMYTLKARLYLLFRSVSYSDLLPSGCGIKSQILYSTCQMKTTWTYHYWSPAVPDQGSGDSTGHTASWHCGRRLTKWGRMTSLVITIQEIQQTLQCKKNRTEDLQLLKSTLASHTQSCLKANHSHLPWTTSPTWHWGSMLPIVLGWTGLVVPSKIRAAENICHHQQVKLKRSEHEFKSWHKA